MTTPNVNCTPSGVFHQSFSAIIEAGDRENFLELDSQTKFNLRRYDLILNDFWGHQTQLKSEVQDRAGIRRIEVRRQYHAIA
jgi:hypothetical protein